MKNRHQLLSQKILLADAHLVELNKHFFNNAQDWHTLRIGHKEEIQSVGFLIFSDWNRQYQEVIELAHYHTQKRTKLYYNQSLEMAMLNEELVKIGM